MLVKTLLAHTLPASGIHANMFRNNLVSPCFGTPVLYIFIQLCALSGLLNCVSVYGFVMLCNKPTCVMYNSVFLKLAHMVVRDSIDKPKFPQCQPQWQANQRRPRYAQNYNTGRVQCKSHERMTQEYLQVW